MDFRNDNDAATISLRYVLPGGGGYPVSSSYAVTPKNSFSCKGSLAKMKEGAKFLASLLGMVCERKIAKKEMTTVDEGIILVPSATISIMATVGTITRHVVRVFKSSPPTLSG